MRAIVLGLLGGMVMACGGATESASKPGSEPASQPQPSSPAAPADDHPNAPAPPAATSGRCSTTPRVVATADGRSTSLAMDDTSVYWASSSSGASTVWKTDKESGQATSLATASNARVVGVGAGTLFWIASSDRTIHRASARTLGTDDASGVSLSSYVGSYTAPLLAVFDDRIMWGDARARGAFASLSSGMATPDVHQLPAPAEVAFGGALLWQDQGAVWRADAPDGTNVTRIGAANVDRIVGYARGVVYALSGALDPTVVAIAPGATAPRVVTEVPFLPSTRCPGGAAGKYGLGDVVVTSDESVYATAWTDCMNGEFVWSVVRALPHQALYELASFTQAGTNERPPFGVDDTCAYWIENGARASLATVAR